MPSRQYVDAVFAEDGEIPDERKEMFLKLYNMGLSQENARTTILASILAKQKNTYVGAEITS